MAFTVRETSEGQVLQRYRYRALDAQGRLMRGESEALHPVDLELRLQRLGLDLLSSRPCRRRQFVRPRIARSALINFCFQLEQSLSAGVPLIEALSDLRDSLEHGRLRNVVAGLIEAIHGGRPLSVAMAEHPHVFKPIMRALVRAGEDTGRLPEVLRHLTDNLKWEDELAAHTRRLLSYPLIAGIVVLAVTAFLLLYLVPQMMSFLRDMGQAIPLQTQLLLTLSDFCVHHGWMVALIACISAIGLRLLSARHAGLQYRLHALQLRLPLLGPILEKIILARFASVVALMYASGIAILDALRAAEDVAGHAVIAAAVRRAGDRIGEGCGVASAFREAAVFPPLLVRMLHVGESTGALDRALLNVGYFYNREVREATARAQAMLEPALTVLLGGFMLWVMLAVLGPIYDTLTVIRL